MLAILSCPRKMGEKNVAAERAGRAQPPHFSLGGAGQPKKALFKKWKALFLNTTSIAYHTNI